MRLEGRPETKLTQMIREVGKNTDVWFRLATVQNPPPNLTIKPDNSDLKLSVEDGDLIVAEHLTEHTRIATVTSNNIEIDMSTEGDPSHTHKINSITLSNAEIEIQSNLNVGDRVIMASTNNNQLHYILDKSIIN